MQEDNRAERGGAQAPRGGLVNGPRERSLSDIEFVVVRTKALRQLLVQELGATGLTIHECVGELEGQLQPESTRRLRRIATLRNKLINDVGVDRLDQVHARRPQFEQECDEAEAGIRMLSASLKAARSKRQASGDASSRAAGAKGKSGCFIATAVYEDPTAWQLDVLRRFRDERLLVRPIGRLLVNAYYRCSPPLADRLATMPRASALVRRCLNRLVSRLARD